MLVTELKVSGYKTLRDVTWHPGHLNVVIGPNASGKSNLLRLLRLINDSAKGQLYDHIINDGGMGAVTWNGEGVGFGTYVRLQSNTDPRKGNLLYGLQLKRYGETGSFEVERESLAADGAARIVFFMRHDVRAEVSGQWLGGVEINPSEALLSQLKGPGGAPQPMVDITRNFANWNINDQLHTEKGAEIRRPSIARHAERLDPGGQNLTAVLHTYYENDAEFQENIDQAMTAAFGDEYRSLAFPPAGSQNIELCVRWKSIKRPQPASTLSDGTLRFLFLITALSLAKPPSLIAIDEPETGLHPAMMRIVAEYAENAALKGQVIFTTHSIAFLNGFSKDEPPTVTVMDLVDGESRMRVLDPETLGRWLKDYTLGQLYQSHELEQMPGLEEAA